MTPERFPVFESA